MSKSELFSRDLENGKLVTVNYICQKENISKEDGSEVLQELVQSLERSKNSDFVILKKIIGKKENKIACSLVTKCELDAEKKFYESIDSISGWLVSKCTL